MATHQTLPSSSPQSQMWSQKMHGTPWFRRKSLSQHILNCQHCCIEGARVSEDVGIAHKHLVVWKRPVRLGASSVMVVEEGHGVRGHPAEEACRIPPESWFSVLRAAELPARHPVDRIVATWWLPVGVPEPPVLRVSHGLLPTAFHSQLASDRVTGEP